MKRIINKIIILGITIGIVSSCESNEKIVDQILEEVGTGAILRTRGQNNALVYNDVTKTFAPDSEYALTIEEQDVEGGDLLQSVDIYVRYQDNSTTEAGSVDISTQEVLLQSLSATDFTLGERDLPETSVSYTSTELVTTTGIDEALVVGKDRFEFRLVLTLTNDEVYTNTDVGGPVSGGSYFSAPFEYFPVVACSITESLAGTHSFVATDIGFAPGADGGGCSGNDLTGTVTWTEFEDSGTVVPGRYVSTDMSFGQFEDCYTDRGKAAGEDIAIEWDCTNLIPDGDVYLNEDGEVVATDDEEDQAFTYSYTITNVSGPEMTIDFSSSAGDRGTVVITREGGVDWPVIFTANND